MHPSTLLAAGLLTGSLVLTAGGAWADSDSVKDKAGDAAPAGDITKVTVRNTGKALTIQTKLKKASAGRTHVVATLTSATEGAATYVARTVESGHGHRVGATLETSAPDATDPTTTVATPVDCQRLHAAVSSGRNGMVTIRIPQSCFGADAGTFTVAVTTVTPAGAVVDQTSSDPTVDEG
ncbi:hypothetical protein [Nocardioides panaciterrulae]|uniref:Uncharacterized protein n=1 Tax=Nocardioides panaciterrulae TaxID=661492 RepID=A0A7Y9JD15_9ACTN|nr:hypothetical protein [Nocardioides panaciterrulae]NYD43881.1 hypothetical protein [Nocardioides panaciterrulae]